MTVSYEKTLCWICLDKHNPGTGSRKDLTDVFVALGDNRKI